VLQLVLQRRRGTMIVLGTVAAIGVRPMPANAEDFDAGKSAAVCVGLFKLSSHALRSGEAHEQLVAR